MAEIKITDEELQQLISSEEEFNSYLQKSGELSYQLRLLNFELSSVTSKLDELFDERMKMLEALQQKYGVGNVDINTGIFTSDV